MQPYIGIVDVAQRFGVSRETVLTWINANQLVAIDTAPVGSNRRRLKFTEESLSAFEELRKTGKPKFQAAIPVHVHPFF